MQCPKCGTENPDDAQVCHFCSSVLSKASATTQNRAPITSGLAIASFVLGILSILVFPIGLIAITLGIVSIVIIKKSGGRLNGTGLAVSGITISVLAFLIYVPVLFKVKQIAFRMVCGENLSALGKAMLIYANDYDDKFPTTSKWCDLLIEHAEVSHSTFRCKGASEGPCNYAMNKNVEKLGTAAPPDMVLLFETHPGWNQVGGPEILSIDNHQAEGCNVLFVDSHVEFVETRDLNDLKWKIEQNE
jgi:prepilin-type processing-associated H-X9-DG protein